MLNQKINAVLSFSLHILRKIIGDNIYQKNDTFYKDTPNCVNCNIEHKINFY